MDTTGCGDSYCGGFITALARGLSVKAACDVASAVAALVATGMGSDAGGSGSGNRPRLLWRPIAPDDGPAPLQNAAAQAA
ncbi:PfkB family carbohydrate kinase [Klebsiella pneumoniae]|nr:PfkB family carbohydrate kinase [Klebsiella pneumoniae]